MILTLIAVNTLGWLVLQLSIAAAATRIDSRYFSTDNRIYRTYPKEISFIANGYKFADGKASCQTARPGSEVPSARNAC